MYAARALVAQNANSLMSATELVYQISVCARVALKKRMPTNIIAIPLWKDWLQQRLKSDLIADIAMATLYEDNVRRLLDEKKKKLEELQQSPDAAKYETEKLEDEIGVLTMLYENYSSGMGAFRRVKGSREHH